MCPPQRRGAIRQVDITTVCRSSDSWIYIERIVLIQQQHAWTAHHDLAECQISISLSDTFSLRVCVVCRQVASGLPTTQELISRCPHANGREAGFTTMLAGSEIFRGKCAPLTNCFRVETAPDQRYVIRTTHPTRLTKIGNRPRLKKL
jgi:hypothetical protein